MIGRLGRCSLAAALALVCLALFGEPAAADDVRPVQVFVRELPSGDFEVRWSVPKLIPASAMPSPRLPDGARAIGTRTLIEQPSAWVTRQIYRCPEGLSGRAIGIDYPFYNMRFSTLLRVELSSGERYTHLLDPGVDTWTVPEGDAGGLLQRLETARAELIHGARHVFHGWVHVVLLLSIVLVGGGGVGIRLVTAFFLAQVGAVVVASRLGLGLESPLAEAGVAIAAVLLARQALWPPAQRSQLVGLAACAGVAHGLGIAGLGALPGQVGEPGVLSLLVFALGMDAVFLVSIAVVTIAAARIPLGVRRSRLAGAATVVLGGVAFALAIHAIADGPPAVAQAAQPRPRLPSLDVGTGRAVLPGSGRVAASAPGAPIQAYVAVEAFEVRCEVLLRLGPLAALVGAGPGPELAAEQQEEVLRRVRDFVFERGSLEIDGEARSPAQERVEFVTLDAQGVLPRSATVLERVDEAWVGVSAVYRTATTAREVAFAWRLPDAASKVPATVIDPESTRSVLLTSDDPVLRWRNELTEDPVPQVSAVAVEPAEISLPPWSLLVLLVGGVASVWVGRRRRPGAAFAIARVVFALALLVGPLGVVAFAAPGAGVATPTSSEARRVLARLLPNVYRALEYRDESAVFDRLATSVEGEALQDVYVDQRRALAMEERGGGAVARRGCGGARSRRHRAPGRRGRRHTRCMDRGRHRDALRPSPLPSEPLRRHRHARARGRRMEAAFRGSPG